ncbi:MAG: DUF4058 family protein [Thermoguttaceae bacterium]
MPSPFPGMDPFIEGQRWKGFHTWFITVLGQMLILKVRPRYTVEVEEYVYLARGNEDPDRLLEPDLAVAETGSGAAIRSQGPAGTAAVIQPVVHTVPVPKRFRQAFLSIRNRQSQNVVTVIELLSPWNKTAGEGRNEYLVKRSNVFYTPAHLVELDLLRGGERLPTREPLQSADFFAFVCRKERLPKAEVYAWKLRQPLPTIPVPLADDDPDVPLDLQAAFTTTYDRAGYDYALDYHLPIEPPIDPATADWVRSVLPQ